MALPATTAFPQNGSIISRWKLDESSGSRADAVGINTLTDNNTVTSTTGPFGDTAALFTKANSERLSISDASQSGLDITGNFSFSAWLNLTAITSGQFYGIFGKYQTTTDNRSYTVEINVPSGVQKMSTSIGTGDGGTTKTVDTSLVAGTWALLTIVYSTAGEVKTYVNGVQIGATQTAFPTSVFSGNAEFALGVWGNTNVDFFGGGMQDAMMWSVALTGANVTTLYDSYTAVTARARLTLLGVA